MKMQISRSVLLAIRVSEFMTKKCFDGRTFCDHINIKSENLGSLGKPEKYVHIIGRIDIADGKVAEVIATVHLKINMNDCWEILCSGIQYPMSFPYGCFKDGSLWNFYDRVFLPEDDDFFLLLTGQ